MGSNHFLPFPRRHAAAWSNSTCAASLHLEDWISARLKLSEINEGFCRDEKAGKDRAQRDHVRTRSLRLAVRPIPPPA